MTLEIRRVALGDRPIGCGRPVAAIGNFDGLHRGHRHILAETLARAAAIGERAAVVTFDPHPVKVLHPGARFGCLRTLDQRLAALAAAGIALAVVLRFDRELAATTADDFAARVLVDTVGIGEVLVGGSFRFGRGRAGDFARLAALGARLGFAARPIAPVLAAGLPISSTRIREAIGRGDLGLAETLLGARFAIDGVVVRGQGRGAGLGFPTANLETANEVLPAAGVYATRVERAGQSYAAATFLGAPATFGETRPVIETHLVDFAAAELYGERLTLEFVARVRDPVKFAAAGELRAQIARDVAAARAAVAAAGG